MEKALFWNNLIKKITAALMIVMLLIPYCFAQVTFGDNKSDLKNAQNQQNDIQNKKKETEDKIAQLKAQSSDLTSLIQGLDAQMGELSASLDDINTPRLQSLKLRLRRHRYSLSRLRLIRRASMRL